MKIEVNNAAIADDSGTYTLIEAARILSCRSRIEKRIRRKNRICILQSRKYCIAAMAFIVIGILHLFVFADEDATAGVFLITAGVSLAIAAKKGGVR